MNTTAVRIKEALEHRGMKQRDLVQKTGIGKSSISTYLKGEYIPKQRNFYKIAKALDVSIDWLMGADVPMDYKKDIADKAHLVSWASNNDTVIAILKNLNKMDDASVNAVLTMTDALMKKRED